MNVPCRWMFLENTMIASNNGMPIWAGHIFRNRNATNCGWVPWMMFTDTEVGASLTAVTSKEGCQDRQHQTRPVHPQPLTANHIHGHTDDGTLTNVEREREPKEHEACFANRYRRGRERKGERKTQMMVGANEQRLSIFRRFSPLLLAKLALSLMTHGVDQAVWRHLTSTSMMTCLYNQKMLAGGVDMDHQDT